MSNFKNWKSTMAFIIFIGVYVYTIKTGKDAPVIEITGYIALYSSLFMMFRSQFTTSIIEKIVDKIQFNK